MVRVELFKIIIDEKRADQVIILKEKNGERQFPIMIGLIEASSIKMKLSGIELPRPLTHDLLMSTITAMESVLDHIMIDALIQDTFHAKLVIKNKEGQLIQVDARPSDSIALAVRARAPIFVDEHVLEQAAIVK
ncbi:MAG: bifunctional nuclease family protein [Candidatus Omnitrophota bacterium]